MEMQMELSKTGVVPMLPAHNHLESDKGFTLIELMVAMTIFAFGMLGLAALQGIGLKYNSNAYERSQAVIFASDMADRIRASIDGTGVSFTNYNGIVSPAVAPAPATCTGAGNACTAAEMAAVDGFEWLTSVAQTLPSGTGTVACATPTCTITVGWTGRFGASSHVLVVRP